MIAVDRPQHQHSVATARIRRDIAAAGMIALAASGCGPDRAPLESGAAVSDYVGELEAVLAPVGEDAEIGFPWIGTILPSGDLVFAEHVPTQGIARLGVDGSFKGLLSVKGRGPGEIGSPVGMRFHAEQLSVADGARSGLHIFDSKGAWLRTLRLATVPGRSFAVLRGDTVAVAQAITSPERFGLPLHVMADGSGILASFGSEGRITSVRGGSQALRLYHLLATAPGDSTFWAAPLAKYRLEHWTPTGELVRVLDIERSWFPPVDWASFEDPNASRTAISDLLVNNDGRIVVLIGRTREAVDDERSNIADAHSRASGGISETLNRMDHVVELIDPRDGSLISSIEIKDRVKLINLLPGGRIFGVRPGPDGVEYPIVLKLPEPFTKE